MRLCEVVGSWRKKSMNGKESKRIRNWESLFKWKSVGIYLESNACHGGY